MGIQVGATKNLGRTLETNFTEILIRIHMFSFKKMYLKMSSENFGHFVLASMCYLHYPQDHIPYRGIGI